MKPTAKKSLRETLADNQKAMRYYAAMSGKPSHEPALVMPPKKERVTREPSDDTEAPVLRAVGELLAKHHTVLFAIRQNSGMRYSEYTNAAGEKKESYTWFYKWARRRSKNMRITDYWGLLTDGRMFAIECKRPSWTKPTDDREREQLEFILTVRYAGGLAGFARSADEAQSILTKGDSK